MYQAYGVAGAQAGGGVTRSTNDDSGWKANHNIGGTDTFGNRGFRGLRRAECWTCYTSNSYDSSRSTEANCCSRETGTNTVWSPIIIDVFGLGVPDLLAGPNAWKLEPQRTSSDDPSVYRYFSMDGGKARLWEWVGPKSGLLMHGKRWDGQLPIGVVDGTDLFGQSTWGTVWKDGYEPLATLDGDKNGLLTGKELKGLYLWLDTNLNAMADPGEVRPVVDYLKEISVQPTRAQGNSWATEGATLNDGQKVASWDWFSAADPQLKVGGVPVPILGPLGLPREDCKEVENPFLYTWKHPTQGIFGYLRFFELYGDWYVVTIGPDFPFSRIANVAPVVPTPAGFEWRIHSGGASVRVLAALSPNGDIDGVAYYSNGKAELSLEAKPLMPPYPMDWVALSFISLPDEVFSDALLKYSGQSTFLIPFGIFQPCFEKLRTFVSAWEK